MLAKENMPRCITPCVLSRFGRASSACRRSRNAQAHGGGQGDARAKGKDCRAAGKESLCHPKGTTGARLCLWLCGPGIPSPTPLGAMRAATGGSLWSWRPGWSLCQRTAGTTKAQLAAGGRESLHLQHNFHPNKRSSGHFQSPTAL